MRLKKFVFAAAALAGLGGCSEASESLGTRTQPIINGRQFTDAEATLSPAVSIFKMTPGVEAFPPQAEPFPKLAGSGMLISPRVVLTARHVINKPLDYFVEQAPGDKAFPFAKGTLQKTVKVLRKHLYTAPNDVGEGEGEEGEGANARHLVDVGILILESDITGTTLPALECLPGPRVIRVTSGVFHEFRRPPLLGLFKRNLPDAVFETINDGTFIVSDAVVNPFTFVFPNNPVDVTPRGLFGGDSGSGVFDELAPGERPTYVGIAKAVGKGDLNYFTHLFPKLCDWIRKFVPPEGADDIFLETQGPVAGFPQHLDGDSEEDLVTLTPLVDDTFALALDRTEVEEQAFEVRIPGSPEIAGGGIGKFSSAGQSLALVADGNVVTVPFNGGPQPAVNGAPDVLYTSLVKARMSGDTIDDVVALTEGGQSHVFVGGPTGLTFDPDIRPISLRLDDDTLTDFVWIRGSGIHTSSSRFGNFFVNLPDDISLDDVKDGMFRRLSGDDSGIEDIVTVGDGIVIWCKSTTFGGVNCENGTLDAPFFAAGRRATGIDVADLTGDSLDDVTITYSNAPSRVVVGQNGGFGPQFGYKVRKAFGADLNADGFPDGITLDDVAGQIELNVRLEPEGTGDSGPIPTGIPFGEPVLIAIGNVNDDGAPAPNQLAAGSYSFDDIVILSGGSIFSLTSNGDGSLEIDELEGQTGFVAMALIDVNGDGIVDIEGTKEDGSVTVYAGGPAGPEPVGTTYTGLPTANSNDGKMLVLSGLGVDTVGATEARLRLRVGPEDTAALAQLKVDIFDGDNGGLHQFDEETSLLKTCYRLSADPCGDSNAGNCSGGPIPPVHLTTISSDTLGDDVWDSIYEGPHAPEASLTGNGQAPFTYELRVFLSEDCSLLPAPGSNISVATADAFKVRSNAMLSQPLGEFSFIGSDVFESAGLGGPYLPYLRNTDYDGMFSLPIAVGSSATEIQLKEADADDTEDPIPGVSLGANAEIQYRLLTPDGSSASVSGADDGGGAILVTNPSGNNDGALDDDLETRIHTIGAPSPGTWTWLWENVLPTNAVHVFAPFGSPTTHEILGARRPRPTLTTAQQATFWQGGSGALIDELPIALGSEPIDGDLQSGSVVIASSEQAQIVLANVGATLLGEVERQLLTAKLNVKRGLGLGEDLQGAFIYGRTVSVRTALGRADAIVSGADVLATDSDLEQVLSLLSSINLGEVTYQYPGVPFPDEPMKDADADGIINLKDNCPPIANPFQEDSDDNRIGDACQVQTSACVLQRTNGTQEAFFSYDNPLSFRAIAAGTRNQVTLNDAEWFDARQPTELAGGFVSNAFSSVIGTDDDLVWALDGVSVLANNDSDPCSGRELARLPFAPRTVLYGAEEVILGDYTNVTGSTDLASVVSGGDLVVGASSVVGHLLAANRATIAEHGQVLGTAVTGDDLSKASTASVSTPKRLPISKHSLDWFVDFGTATHAGIAVQPRERRLLAPGNYGDVVVLAQSELVLQPGTYQFRSLVVDQQASLQINGGAVVLHIAAELEHLGETTVEGEASLVIGYFGSGPATIAGSLHATVIAPTATLTLGTLRNSVYRGAFYGQRLDVRPSTLVRFVER